MSAEPNDYTPDKAIKTIELLARNADMLEQTANNLQDIVEHASPSRRSTALGYEITRSENSSGYQLKQDGVGQYVSRSGHETRNYDDLVEESNSRSSQRAAHAIAALNELGYVAHMVHMDHRNLSHKETQMLSHLPALLSDATRLLDSFAAETTVTPANKKQVVQAKRDANFLRALSEQLGESGPHLTEHNGRMVDREAELLTEDDISKAHHARFIKGVQMLDASHSEALKSNPSYRDRISKRKPLEVLASDPAESKGGDKVIS